MLNLLLLSHILRTRLLVNLAKMFEIVFGIVLLADFAMYFEHYFEVHLVIEFKGSKFQSC
jgi:uncharacterized membrane protein